MKRIIEKAAREYWFDRRDMVGIVGLSLLGTGFWQLSPTLGLIVPGAILCAVAVFGVKG